jgi:hypothetical protein
VFVSSALLLDRIQDVLLEPRQDERRVMSLVSNGSNELGMAK